MRIGFGLSLSEPVHSTLSLLYWTLPTIPTPSGSISYITSDTTATQIDDLVKTGGARENGGIIAVAAGVTLQEQAITHNPTATVYVVTGDVGTGILSQYLPALVSAGDAQTSTRATIASVALSTVVTNCIFLTVNVADATKYKGYLVSGAGNCKGAFYNCEMFGFPLGDYYVNMINAVSGAGFNANDVCTGSISGTVATVLTKTANELLLNITTIGTSGKAVTVTNATDVFGCVGHGLVAGDIMQFIASVLPTGLAANTPYYVIASGLTPDAFKVSASSGGGSINMTSDGTSVVVIANQSHPWFVGEDLVVGGSTISTVASYADYQSTGLYGFKTSFAGGLTAQACYLHSMHSAISPSAMGSGAYAAADCDADLMQTDSFLVIRGDATTPVSTKMHFNRSTRCIGQGADYGNPHCDSAQFAGTGTARATDWGNEEVFGNIVINGLTRGNYQGTPFAEDMTTGRHTMKAVGNITTYYNTIGTVNFAIQRRLNCFIMGNYLARKTPGDAGPIQRTFKDDQGGCVDTYNTEELGGGHLTATGNYDLAHSDANYEAVYEGPFPLVATDRNAAIAEVQSRVRPKDGGPLAYARDYIDWTNKRINLSLEPNKFTFTSKIDQATSSTIEAADWRKNWGPAGVISMVDGEYSVADDSTGTNATAYTSSAGTIDTNKWLKLRQSSSANAATATVATVTVRGYDSTFTVITSAAQSYVAIDNGNTTRSTAAVGATSLVKALIGVRFRIDGYTSGANIFADNASGVTYFRLAQVTNGTPAALRLYLSGTAITCDMANMAPAPQAGMHTHLISIDGTKASALEGGVLWNMDGTMQTVSAPVGWFASLPGSIAFAGNAMGLFKEADGGGVLLDGAAEFFYIDGGDETYVLPDITDPAVFAKFYKDLIGADGSGPTGAKPKMCWYGPLGASDGSTPESWNATVGLSSVGSNTTKMVKNGGNYT